MKPLALADVKARIADQEDKKGLQDYLKQYSKLSLEKSDALIEELRALKNLKIKEEHMVKVSDFLPRDAEEVHKVFNDVSLDEQEVNAVLTIVKNY